MIQARLSGEDATESFIPAVLSLVHEAGNPYLDWFFGGPKAAQLALDRWMRRASSEYWIERVRGLFDDGGLVGGYIALPGAELARCRKADALAALKEVGRAGRSELSERLSARRGLFAAVADEDFYLSNIGVAPDRRGEGFGRILLAEYLAEGTASGYARFRLDVHAGNAAAVRLYESAGFQLVHEHSAGTAGFSYLSMALDNRDGR